MCQLYKGKTSAKVRIYFVEVFCTKLHLKCVNSYTTTPEVYNDDLYTSIKEANVVV